MSRIIRIPFEPSHFDLLEPDPRLAGIKSCARIETLMHGQAMSWIDTARGEVVMCGGYVLRRPGVAWLWFIPSARGSRNLVRAAHFFKRWLATLEDGIRIEAHVLASFAEGLRWAELLGLERESGEPLRLWDGRHDYHVYGKVTGDGNTDDAI